MDTLLLVTLILIRRLSTQLRAAFSNRAPRLPQSSILESRTENGHGVNLTKSTESLRIQERGFEETLVGSVKSHLRRRYEDDSTVVTWWSKLD